MKKTLFSIRNAAICATIAGSVIAVSTPVFANKKNETAKTSLSAQPVVALAANDANSATFRITFNPGVDTKFELLVRDANSEVLYRKNFESNNFSTLLKLQNEGDGLADYNFTIRNLQNGEVHTFNVSSNVKWIRNVVVVKQ